jgi:hypothetical protein
MLAQIADHTVVAWGHWGRHPRAEEVARLFSEPLCLGVTKAGHPRHPLFVRRETLFVPWRGTNRTTAA